MFARFPESWLIGTSLAIEWSERRRDHASGRKEQTAMDTKAKSSAKKTLVTNLAPATAATIKGGLPAVQRR